MRVTNEHIQRTSRLRFVGDGDGRPCILIPRSVVPAWRGVFDERGEYDDSGDSHYDSLPEGEETHPFQGAELFVLQEEAAMTAVVLEGDAVLLARRVAADSESAVVAVAEQGTYRPYLRDGAPVAWTVPDDGLLLMHGADTGNDAITGDVDEEPLSFDLAGGTHDVLELHDGDGVGWSGEVTFPDGHTEAVSVQGYRLVRR